MWIRLILVALLLSLLGTAWQAETRADLRLRLLLRSTAVQLEPAGVLSYGKTSAHFWGSGAIEDLRFTPTQGLSTRLGLARDAALHIPLLRYRDWEHTPGWPARLLLSFDQATLPLPAPWPQQASGTLGWTHRAAAGDLRLSMTLRAAGAAELEGTLALHLAEPASFTDAILLGGQWRYRDLGFAQGQRAELGQRLGADPQNADRALADAILQTLQAIGLPATPPMRDALLRFSHEPSTLNISLSPPGELRPPTLPQFAPADRAAALGLTLEAP